MHSISSCKARPLARSRSYPLLRNSELGTTATFDLSSLTLTHSIIRDTRGKKILRKDMGARHLRPSQA